MLQMARFHFFNMAELYSSVFSYHMFFIHPSISGHLDYNLGCVFVLATVNNGAVSLDMYIYLSTIYIFKLVF